MLTKYLTSLAVTFNPLLPSTAHKTPRLLLSFLPSNAVASGIKITTTVLPMGSKLPSRISVAFKDGKQVVFEDLSGATEMAGAVGEVEKSVGREGVLDLARMGVNDVVEEVDRHCRVLKRKEELSN